MFRLEYLISKVFFHECLNSILVFQSDGYYYCSCEGFSRYSSYDVKEIMYQPLKLIRFAFELFNNIRLCYEYEETVNFFWKKIRV